MIEHSGSLDQKIRLIWGEGLFNLEKESPLCRAIYLVAKQQEKEILAYRHPLGGVDIERISDSLSDPRPRFRIESDEDLRRLAQEIGVNPDDV